ncbi:cytosolic sulfotransferase 5-like isoform X2 [Triticum dicoccoides]|uniref:cytosolic sulfotransferase 5-like isoform X2 n=1 Tax=Triticum dicoccoides TaxID=85692 RepID=UPI000E7CE09D|nr:cytosolic sulfotransferase 5-like isoform X2 [Triticum dicoccoides]
MMARSHQPASSLSIHSQAKMASFASSPSPAMGKLAAAAPEGATDTESSPVDAPSDESLKDFISSLPSREGWPKPLIQYKGYLFKPRMLEGVLRTRRAFLPRADDVVLATQPKCGTTWLKALAFTVATRSRDGLGADHPLLTCYPHHLVPYIEIPGAAGSHVVDLGALPSPRLLATHMPMSLLPPETRSLCCRVVYLCRDPKDTLVSRLHFENKLAARRGGAGPSMDDAFDMFCEGFSPYGPFWDHCLEYWEESLGRPDTILFLKYEEIKLDPARVVRRLASFLGVPLTEQEESSGVADKVARMCSFETLAGLQVNQVGGVSHGNRVHFDNSVFYRKGEVGDWVNHMSREMGEKLDRIVQQKLHGSGLVF